MSFDAGVINGAVTLDDSEFKKTLNGLEPQANAAFKRIAQIAGTYLTLRGAFGFVNSAMAEFSKVEEGLNKLKYSYSEIPATAKQAAKEIQETFNVSESTATNAIANIGDLLTGFGFDQNTALNFAKQISERGIDVASFKGLNQAETIDRMTVALTGNTNILRGMGVVIRQDSEEFKKQISLIMEETGATEEQAKAQAILNETMKQTSNAAGDYLREDAPRTYAQELTDLGEALKDFYAAAGEQMVSVTQPAVVTMRKMLDVFGKGDDAMRGLITRTVAMSAAFALLAKTNGFTMLNNLPKTLGLIGMKQKAEKDLVIATENAKRAEYAKTDAYRERLGALNSLRVAKAQKEELESSVAAAQIKLRLATSEEDVAAAKRTLAAETVKLTKAQVAESQATQNLIQKSNLHRTAIMQYTVAKEAEKVATEAATRADTFAGRAKLALVNSWKSAKAAAASFYATLGPLGVAMLALTAGYTAATYISEKWRKSLEAAARMSEQELQTAKEREEQMRKLREEESASISRLEELSNYTRLSSSEQTEAQTIIRKLTERYGKLNAEIDKNTGKLKLNAEAFAKMNRKQLEEEAREALNVVNKGERGVKEKLNVLLDDLGDKWTNFGGGLLKITGSQALLEKFFGPADLLNDTQREIQKIFGMTAENQLSALESLRNELSSEGKNAEVEKIKAVIAVIEEQAAAEKRLLEIEKALSRNQTSGIGSGKGGSTAEQSKSEREAITAIEETELKIRMKHADAQGKIAELNKQIADLFEKNAPGNYATVEEFLAGDRYSMNEDALTALNKILELREQILDIEKQSNDESAKFLQNLTKEYNSYEDMLDSRREKKRNDRINRSIDAKLDSGDRSGALSIATQQLKEAQATAKQLRSQYEAQIKEAGRTGNLDIDSIRELRGMIESAFSDVDKWQSRIESINKKEEKKERENIRTVGGWSAELLSAQVLGTNTAQAQTAKYSKQSAEHLKNIDEKVDEYGEYGP